ncbi:base excision DNA repair protein [Boeremia exigua]|uniref:base excision DNA repair protein n=1 Tax=Boeremia exigua TaxID=749465 RepID=UPI001E8CCE34|nr:base excision DNA repair protein [Boeremia exigua]KAH6628966.1 base excision DNA repair protein [Boeremia exigua]
MARSTRAAARAAQQTMSNLNKRSVSLSASTDEEFTKRVKRIERLPMNQKASKNDTSTKNSTAANVESSIEPGDDTAGSDTTSKSVTKGQLQVDKKWKSWSANAASTPYPDFGHPTNRECQLAYDILYKLHNDAATSWSNAKRAMDSMKQTYGSVFAYDKIYASGTEKLQETIRCGGLHIRKTKIIMTILEEVKRRYGRWDLDHLLDASDEDAMKELISYKYIGPKSAFVVMGWCLKRNRFTVDTHVYRIAGLWGWRPKEASREKTQSHLDAVIPAELKFKLHFFLIQHGRTCSACRGGSKERHGCEVQEEVRRTLSQEGLAPA